LHTHFKSREELESEWIGRTEEKNRVHFAVSQELKYIVGSYEAALGNFR